MGNRTIQQDLKLLVAILNWAAKSRDEEGKLLLDSNPLRGLKAPTERNPTRVVLTQEEYEAMLKASAVAGLEPKRGRGRHSLRRKFASDLMDQPLKVLCELGGWKTAHTVLQCYQRPDEDRLREALEARRRAAAPAKWRESNSWNSTSRSRTFNRGL